MGMLLALHTHIKLA